MRELLGVSPDLATLSMRLAKIRYQNPRAGGFKSMTLLQFAARLREHARRIEDRNMHEELADLVDKEEIPGLDLKIRKSMIGIAEILER